MTETREEIDLRFDQAELGLYRSFDWTSLRAQLEDLRFAREAALAALEAFPAAMAEDK